MGGKCVDAIRWSGTGLIRCHSHDNIFTSSSSVDQEPKATCSGNARLHGMQCVTKASIAYVATQVGYWWSYSLHSFTPCFRLISPWQLHRFSPRWIWSLILSAFIIPSLSSLMIPRRKTKLISCWHGGTGIMMCWSYCIFSNFTAGKCFLFTWTMSTSHHKIVLLQGSDRSMQNRATAPYRAESYLHTYMNAITE